MDVFIFYAFLLVLFIAFLIEGHRETSKVRPQRDRPVERSKKSGAISLIVFVGVTSLGMYFVVPWIEEQIPGANAGWVASYIAISVLFAGAVYVAGRLTGRRDGQR